MVTFQDRLQTTLACLSQPRVAGLALRASLALAFLSAVADRFGLWGAPGADGVVWGNYGAFLDYTHLLLPFLPRGLSDLMGTLATLAELIIAVGLLIGLATRLVALVSAALLACFAFAMFMSFGPKPVLDYSVLTAIAAALSLSVISKGGTG